MRLDASLKKVGLNWVFTYFQIFAPEESASDSKTGVVGGIKAEEYLVHPHHRAASKSRQEGFELNEEETKEFSVSSTELKSGNYAVHRERRERAARKEKQAGVSKFVYL